ncbi:hypothetical protein F5Y01DRAFT_326327 [Xylaria sp. FL0043]|nr:hypothetical protein F5Y01DRAFT_326327 [Xylaria sp. FL0043]
MSSAQFQKYLEEMNREPLGKKPGQQRSSTLLPHQRTGPNEELKLQSPNLSEKQVERGAYQQDNMEALPRTSMNNGSPHGNSSTPTHNRQLDGHHNIMPPSDRQSKPSELQSTTNLHQRQDSTFDRQEQQYNSPGNTSITGISPGMHGGLAKSRWADSTYKSTPVGKFGQPLNSYSTPLRSQQKSAVAKPTVTPASNIDDYWKPDGNCSSPLQYTPVTLKSGSNIFEENTKDGNFSTPVESDHTQSNGWATLEDVRHKDGESGLQLSMPQTSVATTREGINVINQSTASFNHKAPDPRVNWPTELYTPSKFNDKKSSKKSSDEVSISADRDEAVPQHVTEFIEFWIQSAHTVEAEFLSQGDDLHEDCDVDTYNGVLMQPIEYHRTKPRELMSRRQMESTSALLMSQFVAEIRRRDPERKAQRKAEKAARAAARAAAAAAEAARPDTSFDALPNPNEVQIPCHLRPAVESDIEAIAAIYNQEIADGYKVMDTKPVEINDFQKLYNQSLEEKLPFIVAVEGWYGSMDTTHHEVAGFALITTVSRGIAGSCETLSTRGGKLVVIVKPEFRRKKIGTALMDIIVTNCTGWHMPKGGYQFVNFTHDWISTEFGHNPRKWWYLEIEIMIRSAENEKRAREGEEFQWIWNFLEAKFNLLLKHYDEKCFYQPHKMYWLDKLTFRRDCCTRGE